MDTNQSFWASTIKMKEPKILKGSHLADIAIVGAGLLGISAAFHLNHLFPEKKIAVIEAVRVANGASGRNGGNVLALTARESWESMSSLSLKRRPLTEAYRKLWDKTLYGLDLFQEIVDQYKIECGYTREGFLSLASSRRDADFMARHAEKATEIGIPIRFADAEAYRKWIDAEGYFGALYHPGYGQINPARYVKGLSDVIKEKGVDLFERSPVLKIEEGPKCILSTPEGRLKADAVVLATNAYTPRLGYFKNRIAPVLNPCGATERLGPEELHRIGWHATRGFDDSSLSVWYMGISEDYRLIIGGGDLNYLYAGKTSFPPERLDRYRAHFEKALVRRFPAARNVRIEYVWTGPIGASLDLGPSVGVTGEYLNIYYGLGFTGEGVNLAHLSGKIVADLYADNPGPWCDLPFVNRMPKRIPPEPIRYVALKSAITAVRALSR